MSEALDDNELGLAVVKTIETTEGLKNFDSLSGTKTIARIRAKTGTSKRLENFPSPPPRSLAQPIRLFPPGLQSVMRKYDDFIMI